MPSAAQPSPPTPEPAARRPGPLAGPLARRQALGVLVSGALGLLAGCRRTGRSPAATASPMTVTPDPLVPDLADEVRLLSVYDAALGGHPGLADRLRPLRANHAAHVAALRQAMGLPAQTGTAGPAGSAPSGAGGSPPASPAATLAELRSLEHAAAAARAAAAIRAGGGRAALLASLAACSASHEVVLA